MDVEGLDKPFSEEEFLVRYQVFEKRKHQALTVSQWHSGSFLGIL